MDEHLQLPGHECCEYCENIGGMEPSWKDYYLEQTVKLTFFRNDKKEDNLPEHLLAPLLFIAFPLHIVNPLHR